MRVERGDPFKSGRLALPPKACGLVPPAVQTRPTAPKPRVALYSHDTMGLGHMRRNLLIASTLAASAIEPTVLLLAGAREAGAFALPPGVDTVTLPALRKNDDGQYASRHLRVSLPEVSRLRAGILASALEGFAPDLLIVDNVPRGALKELDLALRALRQPRRDGGRTRCVLGLRDVRDDPQTVLREWQRDDNEQAVLDFYDEVWVYGDPTVYDLMKECAYSTQVTAKARYVGYLDPLKRLDFQADRKLDVASHLGLPPGKLVMCMVGGGQDGMELARAFVDSEMPSQHNGVLMTGPYMPTEVKEFLRGRSASNPRLRVLDFVAEPMTLLRHADRVITMGGYNSVCEVLSLGISTLIVPRVKPRLEQWIRADRLQRLGVADVLHPDELNPQALQAWLRHLRPPADARARINLDGLSRLPRMALELIQRPAATTVAFN